MTRHYFGAPVLMPDPVVALRDYLLGEPVVTDIVEDRISTDLPRNPTWPRLRITGLNAFQQFPGVLDRVLVQFDCYALIEVDAHRLAQAVRAAMSVSAAFYSDAAVFSGATGLSLFSLPDGEYTPPMPRWCVTAYVHLRPNHHST